jgi:type II secretory pathway pseudopilin PulG
MDIALYKISIIIIIIIITIIAYSMLACKQKQEQDTLHEHRTFIRFFKH